MILLNEIEKKKLINKGMFGLIFLGSDNDNNQYAIKFSKIDKKSIVRMYREFDFCQEMSNKYPNHFVKFYDYKFIIDNKEMDFSEYFYLLDEQSKKIYDECINSEFISVKLYSYIDLTLYDLLSNWKSFNSEIFNNLLIQVIYVIYLINLNGYYHADLHFKNIGLVKTNNKYIDIFNNKIPTYGYYVTIIDNDNVLHKKYDLDENEINEITYKNDIFGIINSLYSFEELKCKYNEFKNINYIFFNIDDEDKNVINKYLDNINLNDETRIFLNNTLYKLLFYEKIQKNILKNKFIKTIKPYLLISLDKILFTISNIDKPQKILEYLITNRFE